MKALVAGIGNIFMGDDGFGCEVAQRLSRSKLPEGVDVVDFGIRSMDLGYALTADYEVAILIDTVERNDAPGTVFVIEPAIEEVQLTELESGEHMIVPHAMDLAKILRFVASLGRRRPRVLLVACQPEYLGGAHGHIGLSIRVAAAVDEAVREVEAILRQIDREQCRSAGETTAIGLPVLLN